MPIDVYLALVLRVSAGVYAIQAQGAPVELARAAAYGVAATYEGVRAGIDPFELVAVARNESDFVEHARGPDGKDCGLTQTRVTVSRFSCGQLLSSYRLAFREAARELSEYAQACRGKPDFARCRVNRYNSGVRYARTGVHGRYWIRIACFRAAALAGAAVRNQCRRARSLAEIDEIVSGARASRPTWAPLIAGAAGVPTG